MPRNPAWVRDELILALDLYFRENPLHTSQDNPRIIELSTLLNRLPIHNNRPDPARFRNPNGVYMKLCNFLRFDNLGVEGLRGGGRQEEEIWNEFSVDRPRLAAVASSIRAVYGVAELSMQSETDDQDEFPEGRILTRLHILRERNRKAVNKKKQLVLERDGRLACEACGFDFLRTYGQLGDSFIDCHHTTPISALSGLTITKVSDLALVCANCHRMLHRSRLWLSIRQLRDHLRQE